MENYILFYGDKKPEDNILITNMFKKSKKINLCWTELDYNNDFKLIEEEIKQGIEQIIFLGLEIGWDKLILKVKENYSNVKVKVICNTMDSLLYYEYERENFFKLLELSKNKNIDDIGFLRKSQYITYSSIGYECSYILENFELDKNIEKEKIQLEKNVENGKINIGIYPLNYVWDKNIFNQLCISKFVENSVVNFNDLDSRMKEFLDTMKISNNSNKIEKVNYKCLIENIMKNDVVVSCSFTEYIHPIFFISMELGIPCLIGNNSDLFEENSKLQKYVVTTAEDNPIINAEKVNVMLKEKNEIIKLYKEWKKDYSKKAEESIEQFIRK